MRTKKILLILGANIIFCNLSTNAQTFLGIEYKPFYLSADGIKNEISFLKFSLSIKQDIDSTKSIVVKPGVSIGNDSRKYAGVDISVLGQYLFNPPLYVNLGFHFHKNSTVGLVHVKTNNYWVTFFYTGFGFNISSKIYIESGFYLPLFNKTYAIDSYSFAEPKNLQIQGIFDFGIGMDFEL